MFIDLEFIKTILNGLQNRIENVMLQIRSVQNNVGEIQTSVGEIQNKKMDKNDPTGTGSFSLNRKAGTTIGNYSFTEGYSTTASGERSHAEGSTTTASGERSHAEGNNTSASSYGSHAEGQGTTASGDSSHAEGYGTTASGNCSHAEGSTTTASSNSSHAEGDNTIASGNTSHAEGYSTTAEGYSSHAEGDITTALGYSSHAEGKSTTASGENSHTEGYGTTASGNCSHAEGYNTIASGNYSHVQGKYNIEDTTNTYVDIIGNGKYNARSNAATVDWSGNAWFAGDVFVGGSSQDDGIKLLKTGEAIPVPQTASVGQTIVAKAVDENGKPTEWEVADMDSYILPIASADILGGVKPVVKTDNMTQLVGVDESGALFTAPNTWELINTITLEEDTNIVIIDKDSNGNSFDLKAVAFYMDRVVSDLQTSSGTMYIGRATSGYFGQMGAASTATRLWYYHEFMNNHMGKDCSGNTASGNMSISVSYAGGAYLDAPMIRLYGFYHGAGTKITLYGVRK